MVESEPAGSVRVDWVAVAMVLATCVAVAWTAWLRFGRAAPADPPAVGSRVPLMRLVDLETSEPRFVYGMRGRVQWVVFWSAGSPSVRASMPQLDAVWRRLKAHPAFSLLTAAVGSADAAAVRAALAASGPHPPAYLASPETTLRFGVQEADPPLHVLIDAQGRIGAMARGAGSHTIDRLAGRAARWLEELEPPDATRFATNAPREVVGASPHG